MLHSARERYEFERKYRDEVKERRAEVAALLAAHADAKARDEQTIARLRDELDEMRVELDALV
eukprot:6814926-Prymnesium_polylepis.1